MTRSKIYFQWVIASTVGWILGWIAMGLIDVSLVRLLKYLAAITTNLYPYPSALDEVIRNNIGDGIPGNFIGVRTALRYGLFFGAIYGATFGAVGGFMQSLVLQRHIYRARWWIVASAVVWACIFAIFWGRAWGWGWTETILATTNTVYGLLSAAAVGGIEWLVLRRQLTKAHWWILATILTWFLSRAIVLHFWNRSLTFPLSWLWLLVGTGHGVVTGVFLLRLLKPSDRRN